jgi:putative effector of murein hydrolase
MPTNLILGGVLWSVVTLALYWGGKVLHRRHQSWWSSPLLTASVFLILVLVTFHVSYGTYAAGTHWLVQLLAPATVAFAVPIYEQRALIRRYWPVLTLGAVVGSAASMGASWGMASLLGLDHELQMSLLPRSVTTPFAVIVSHQLGGTAELTAVFVVITGVLGAAIGEVLSLRLPLKSPVSRGALFGMGAHAVGTAKAHQLDGEVGALAGVVMIFVGLLNVALAPVVALLVR